MNIKVFVNYQDDTGWHDISAYIKYNTLSITHNAFSTSYKYAQNECSFDVIYNSDVFPSMSQTHSDVLLRIIDLQSGNASDFIADPSLFFTCETLELATALFYGHIPNTKSWDYNGIADNTIISVEAVDDLDYLDVPIGDLVCSNCEVLNPSDKANSLLHYLLFKGNWGDERVYKSDFSTDSDGWSAANGTITANGRYLAVTASDAGTCVSRAFSFSGSTNPFISFDVSSSGNNPTAVKIYYSTSSHGYSNSYYKSLSFSDNTGTWSNFAADMSDLTAGGTDWSDNTITGIKILLDDSVSGGIFNLHNVIIGNVSRIVSDVTISTVIEKFAPDSEDDSLLTIIDTLLYEYGYSLNCNAMGYISPVKWAVSSTSNAPEFNDDNIVDKISVKDAVKTYDSVKLTYYYLNSADNIRLYTDSNCSYDDDGTLAGYDILNSYYYPADANAIDTSTGTNKVVEQEYTDDGISYATNYSVMNNLDYDYSAFSSDFSSIVATGNHYMDRLEDNGLTHVIESFGNKKCRLLYRNTSGSTVKLYANNVYGTVWYKSSAVTNELDLVTVPKNIYGYTADYIYDDTVAEKFTAALAAQYSTGLVTFTFSSETFVSQGTLTHLYSSDAGISIYALIKAVQYDNKTEMYSYTCISCSVNRADLTRTSIKQIATVNVDAPYLMSVDNSSLVVPFSSGVGDYSKAISTAVVTQNGIDVTNYFAVSASVTDGISGTLSGYTYKVTGMTVASGTITITLTKNSVDYTKTITVTRTGEEGVTVSINAVSNVFVYDTDGETPSPSSSVVTASLFNYSGTVYYEFFLDSVSVQNTTSNVYTYTPESSYSDMPQTIKVKVHKSSSSGDALAIDSISMYGVKSYSDGVSALTYLQKNASQSVPATSDGTVSSYANTNNVIRVFEGDTELQAVTGTPSGGQYKVTAVGTDITAGTVSVSGLTVVVGLCSGMTALQAYVTYTITGERADGTAFSTTLQQNITKAVAGTDGGGIIQISDPDSTTPESGMVYDNTYYGMWQGSMYLWTWSSTTTGYWTQVSADTPPTPAVRYSFDDMPDLPDASGQTNDIDDVVSQTQCTITTNDDGTKTVTASGSDPTIIIQNSNVQGKIIIADITIPYGVTFAPAIGGITYSNSAYGFDSFTTIYSITGEALHVGKNRIAFVCPTNPSYNYAYFRLDVVAASGDTYIINDIYIGDGTTSRPIIDNISGAHNSIAQSGVVSTTGVSGKACKFLGASSQYIKFLSLSFGTDVTMGMWTYFDNVSDTMTLIQNRNTAEFGLSVFLVGGKIRFDWGTVSTIFEYSFSANTLYHITVTANSTQKSLYVNGALVQTVAYTYADNSSYFTNYMWTGASSTTGTSFSGNLINGWLDDVNVDTTVWSAPEILGLYLQRASAAKLYTLADYNYDTSVSSWEITSSAAAFSKSRAGVVTPSSITFSAKAVVASVAQAYAGRFIIYISDDGTTFTPVYTSSADESSYTYTIPSDIAAIRVELYKSGGTSVLVATKDYSVPYDASVKPQYLGIGLLADVSGLTTKAYTSATITDAGVITPGSPVSAVITGDWVINYTAGTYRALGIYYWSGSAWTITSDSKYTSDGVIEDVCRLNNGGILIPDWTVYVNLIADNLFSHTIKLTTKTISGTTYAGVFYGGDRFNADGSIADRSANGFYFSTNGKGWCNLQSDDLYNTIAGTDAGLRLISGSGGSNTLYGAYAGYCLTRGYNNTLCGDGAGYNLTTGSNNTLYGAYVGDNLTTGYNNTLCGIHAGYNLDTADHCLVLGYNTQAYSPSWNYQMNLNNRIIYLEFASDATQDTVYTAITHYIGTTAGFDTSTMGHSGSGSIAASICVLYLRSSTVLEAHDVSDRVVMSFSSGSSSPINYPVQVAFIVPSTPTNK